MLGFAADLFVEGHGETVTRRAEQEELRTKLRVAHNLAEAGEDAPPDADEDLAFFVGAFAAGR